MICTNCGQNLSEGNRFCEHCGAPISVSLPKKEGIYQPLSQQGMSGVVMEGGACTEKKCQ